MGMASKRSLIGVEVDIRRARRLELDRHAVVQVGVLGEHVVVEAFERRKDAHAMPGSAVDCPSSHGSVHWPASVSSRSGCSLEELTR